MLLMLCCHICNPPPHFPLCRVLQDTGQSSEKMEIQLQCTWLYSLTAEMRLEALKAHGSAFDAGYQAIVAMLRQKAPIKVQRVARWGWTAPQCSTYLWGALFTLTTVGTGERRAGKCFGFVYTSGSSVKEREREKKEMNKAERCIAQAEPIEMISLKVV